MVDHGRRHFLKGAAASAATTLLGAGCSGGGSSDADPGSTADHRVLIIGSGFLTHGLPYLKEWRIDAAAPGWSKDFDQWASEALAKGDIDTLAAYRDLAPGMPYAHPTVEHFTPLFVTLGAAHDPAAPAEQLFEGFWMGLSKRSLMVA